MRFFNVLTTLLFLLVFSSSTGLCFIDATTIDFKGFRLGMSLEKAIKNLQAAGYLENKGSEAIAQKEYSIKAYFNNDIPLHQVTVGEGDQVEFTLQFGNRELVLLVFDKPCSHDSNASSLIDKYTRTFGNYDFRREKVLGDKAVQYCIWGGEMDSPETPPLAPHVQVEITSRREPDKEVPISEMVRMVDSPRLMGLQYAETLEQYIKGNALYESMVREKQELSKKHIPKLLAAIEGDARYKRIKIKLFQGDILMTGPVREGDLKNLREIVAATSPPANIIKWNVREYPATIFK